MAPEQPCHRAAHRAHAEHTDTALQRAHRTARPRTCGAAVPRSPPGRARGAAPSAPRTARWPRPVRHRRCATPAPAAPGRARAAFRHRRRSSRPSAGVASAPPRRQESASRAPLRHRPIQPASRLGLVVHQVDVGAMCRIASAKSRDGSGWVSSRVFMGDGGGAAQAFRQQAFGHRGVAQAQPQLSLQAAVVQAARFAHEAQLHRRQPCLRLGAAMRGGRGRPHRSAARSK